LSAIRSSPQFDAFGLEALVRFELTDVVKNLEVLQMGVLPNIAVKSVHREQRVSDQPEDLDPLLRPAAD
jgi:hypothetical protein